MKTTEDQNGASLKRVVSGQILPANKLVNVRRRAERAMGGETIESIVTCPASRHVMLLADAMLERHDHPLLEDPEHCAGSIYSVLESLWKARAEIKRLRMTATQRSAGAENLTKYEHCKHQSTDYTRVR